MTATKKYPFAKAPAQTLGERFKNAIENEPPTGEQQREAYWNDTLFLAMAELRAELKSENERVRSKAAHKIIDLERTKMRHGKRLGGAGVETRQAEYPPPADGASRHPATSPTRGEVKSVDSPDTTHTPGPTPHLPPCGGGRSERSEERVGGGVPSVVDGLKAELERVADLKAQAETQAETEAFGYYALRIRTMVDDLAKKYSFGWKPMSVQQSEGTVRKYMEMKPVSAATEIDGRDLLLMVMDMVADEKERREKEKAGVVVAGRDAGLAQPEQAPT